MLSDYRELSPSPRQVQATFPLLKRAPATCFIVYQSLPSRGVCADGNAIASVIANRDHIVDVPLFSVISDLI